MGRQMRTVLVATVAVVVSLLVPATAQASTANLGPVLGPLPTTATGGGPGTASLNALVSRSCNSGADIASPTWFSLPTGNVGWLVARGQVKDDVVLGHGNHYGFTAHVALVDHANSAVLSCTGGPYQVSASHPTAVVVWISSDDAALYASESGGGSPPTTVYVTRTSGMAATHDMLTTALPISTLPAASLEDTTMARFDIPMPNLLMGCNSDITGIYSHAQWWKWTAAWTGALPVVADTPDFNAVVLLLRSTPTGVEPVDVPRDDGGCPTGPYSVTSGSTYYVGVAYYSSAWYQLPAVEDSGFVNFYLGSPSMPVAPTVSAVPVGNDAISVSWVPPTLTNGQSAITQYYVTIDSGSPPGSSGGGVRATVAGTSRAYTFTGLSSGSRYHVTVNAVNSAGMGAPRTVSVVTGPASVGSPQAVDVTVDSAARSATLTWSPPSGSVTGYRVSRDGLDSHGAGAFTTTVPATSRSFTFTSLLGTSTYHLKIAAMTSSGDGRPAVVAAMVLPIPVVSSHPVVVKVVVDDVDGSATLTWEPPRSDGQSPTSGFVVSRNGTDTSSSGPFSTIVPASARTFRFTSLNPWFGYDFSVAAVNAVGTGPAYTVTGTYRALTPPPPTGLAASASDGAAEVAWVPPASVDGAAPPTAYRVRLLAGTTQTVLESVTVGSGTTSWTASGLTNGSHYTFDVTSINASGPGGVSLRSSVVTPSPPQPVITVPQGPRIKSVAGSVVKGRTIATVRWAAPANGGKPILGYRVYAYKVDAVGHVLSSSRSTTISASRRSWSMTFSGVSRYRFAMRAVNAIGWSAYGGLSTTMAPASAPSAPRMGRATSGVPGGAVTASVTWSAPRSNGGTVVTGYRVFIYQLSAGGDVLSVTTSSLLKASARSWTGRLPAAGPYAFAIRAVNAMGQSRASARSSTVTGR